MMLQSQRRGVGDTCTVYDNNDTCIGWTVGPGGGSYSGINQDPSAHSTVDAPSGASSSLPANMSIAGQQAALLSQFGAFPISSSPVLSAGLPGSTAASSGFPTSYLIIAALGLGAVVLLKGRR